MGFISMVYKKCIKYATMLILVFYLNETIGVDMRNLPFLTDRAEDTTIFIYASMIDLTRMIYRRAVWCRTV